MDVLAVPSLIANRANRLLQCQSGTCTVAMLAVLADCDACSHRRIAAVQILRPYFEETAPLLSARVNYHGSPGRPSHASTESALCRAAVAAAFGDFTRVIVDCLTVTYRLYAEKQKMTGSHADIQACLHLELGHAKDAQISSLKDAILWKLFSPYPSTIEAVLKNLLCAAGVSNKHSESRSKSKSVVKKVWGKATGETGGSATARTRIVDIIHLRGRIVHGKEMEKAAKGLKVAINMDEAFKIAGDMLGFAANFASALAEVLLEDGLMFPNLACKFTVLPL